MQPRRYPIAVALFSVALAFMPARARAQQTGQPFQKGTRSISLSLNGDANFGLWQFTSSRRARGLVLGVNASFGGQTNGGNTSDVTLSIGPRWKLYMEDHGPVAPYMSIGADIRGSRSTGGGQSTSGFGLDGILGLGVDWFPANRVSIGGYTGARLGPAWTWSSPGARQWALSLKTLTTGVTLQIYF